MKNAVLVFVLLSLLKVGAAGAEMRTWTSTKGDTIEAQYVRLFPGGKVVLKTSDGRELKIPVDGLCARDQEYLASLVPPKLKIDVDVDVDTDTKTETDGYVRKADTVKCKVLIKKTNKEPSSRSMRAYMLVFAQEVRGDNRWLITSEEKSFSFADGGKEMSFQGPSAEVQYTDSDYSNARGFRYEGYLVVVENDAGEVVAMESNQSILEKKWRRIKGASKGTVFDKDFDRLDRKMKQSNNSGFYYY